MRLPYLLMLLPAALAQKCPIHFDGRVPRDTTPQTFDTNASLYNPSYVLGEGQKWSQVLKFPPHLPPSLFSTPQTHPLEVTISDSSIFQSQTGFRRSELLPASNTGSDASTTGIKTIHFSLRKDPLRPLNASHEYQLFWLESNDFSTDQVVVKYGTLLTGQPKGVEGKDMLIVQGNVNSKPVPTLFATRFTEGVWHNFGLELGFVDNTTQVFYSKDRELLRPVSSAVGNDLAGRGQYHFGVLKKPTSPGEDVTKSGYQEGGIDEGVVFGGVFIEDSSKGCISLGK